MDARVILDGEGGDGSSEPVDSVGWSESLQSMFMVSKKMPVSNLGDLIKPSSYLEWSMEDINNEPSPVILSTEWLGL